MRSRALLLVIVASLATSLPARAAEDPEQLFAAGNALMEQGNYEAALERFVAAQKLDPGVGTQFNIAVCHEKLGHLSIAYKNYVEVQRFAHAAGKTQREEAAKQKIAALMPRLSYFVIDSREPGDVLVKIDGQIVDRSGWSFVPVDTGSHHVEASTPNKRPWTNDVSAPAGGEKVNVVIPVLLAAEGKTVTLTKETTNTKRTVGYVIGGVGVVGLVAAGITGLMILDAKSTADKHCAQGPNNNHCVDPVTGLQDETGTNAVSEGKTLTPINAVAWGVGAVGVGVGAFLLITSGKKDDKPATPKVSFTPLPGGGFLGLSGTL